MYIGKKLKLDASYGYANIHWNYPITYQRVIGTTNEISQGVSTKSPNDFNLQRMNNINLGLDYSCGNNSVIYWRSSFHMLMKVSLTEFHSMMQIHQVFY